MRDFWAPNKSYNFLRCYIDWCTRRSFTSIETHGTLPPMDDGAWFIVSNHTHTLMDALVILQMRREGTAFGARADVFRNPVAARFLHFCKIVPLARKDRERPEEVAHNRETMGVIDQVVAHGVPFCLFPEGRHRPMHSLLPLRRGIAMMAFRSAAQRPTKILPIGLEYSSWFHFRGRASVNIGEPLDVNAFAASLEPGIDDSTRDSALQEELFKRLSSLILYIPDDEHYDERLAEIKAQNPPCSRFWRILLTVVTFPLFLIAAVLALPMWAIAEFMCKFKIKDTAWNNTVRFGVKMVGTPVFFLLWAIIGFILLPWWGALLLLAAFLPSYSLFYDWLNLLWDRT